ncbi:hypothetical protein ABT160_34165 [Streptomyces sp. NPDC001941]|uniref:hypothetical protein n=1 Tax=Streptomyces sp. NPDC001941 TaxID=3154659 RepID=UPI003333AA64
MSTTRRPLGLGPRPAPDVPEQPAQPAPPPTAPGPAPAARRRPLGQGGSAPA